MPDEKAKEVAGSVWCELLTRIEKQLGLNSNPNFLVGNSITTADCAFGAFLLKYYIGDHFVHK